MSEAWKDLDEHIAWLLSQPVSPVDSVELLQREPTFTHANLDERILGMVRLCVQKLDAEPSLFSTVRSGASRIADPRIKKEWEELLALPWPELKSKLLEATEAGDQLRQNVPFGGLLTNEERTRFFNEPLNRIERIKKMARLILPNDEAVDEWLRTPAAPLGNRAPIDLLETDAGIREIERFVIGVGAGAATSIVAWVGSPQPLVRAASG